MNRVPQSDIMWRSHLLRQALVSEANLASELDAVSIERDICGEGPNARNSGMLLSTSVKFASLWKLRCETEALRNADS